LNSKLENLENVFIGSAIQRNANAPNLRLTENYANSTVMVLMAVDVGEFGTQKETGEDGR
jgi:hypothetical protein